MAPHLGKVSVSRPQPDPDNNANLASMLSLHVLYPFSFLISIGRIFRHRTLINGGTTKGQNISTTWLYHEDITQILLNFSKKNLIIVS